MRDEIILGILGRERYLFVEDIQAHEERLKMEIEGSSFLVIGGAGSIGSSTVLELLRYGPRSLHVVDVDENGLAQLLRNVRSSFEKLFTDVRTFCVDAGSDVFLRLLDDNGPYDYILNFSAMKHVRSEKDPYTLMRMVEVNVLNNVGLLEHIRVWGAGTVKKYFAVSTDKAANPVNVMGATKRLMEFFLMKYSADVPTTTARFANVAFSKGSLLEGFVYRLQKRQPISAPNDVRRYFITPRESGMLCTLATILGDNRELFFPKLDEDSMLRFDELAVRFLKFHGFEPYVCKSEEEARSLAKTLPSQGKWPCYFFGSDTTGEKEYEEFYTSEESVDLNRFKDVGIVRMELQYDGSKLEYFIEKIDELKKTGWSRAELVSLLRDVVPNFEHKETGKFLDQRM